MTGINASSAESPYGVHDWSDEYGNHGTEVLSQLRARMRVVRTDDLFGYDANSQSTPGNRGLAEYFIPGENPKVKRRVFVVVDNSLTESQKSQIEQYFISCKREKQLEDYSILPLAPIENKTEKTIEKVKVVITAAKKFGMRRRDLFIAIGGTVITDIVGFAASIYRRSTPYLSVLTDLVGAIHSHASHSKVRLNHVDHEGKLHSGIFSLPHMPLASFYDPTFLHCLHKDEIRRGLVEMIKISILSDVDLFSYLEACMGNMLANSQGGYLTTAVELAAAAIVRGSNTGPSYLSPTRFGDETAQAIEELKGTIYDNIDCTALGVALTSTLAFLQGGLPQSQLKRVLDAFENAGLPVWDDTLSPEALLEHMSSVIQKRGLDSRIVVPLALGRSGALDFANLSQNHMRAALDILHKHSLETTNHEVETAPFPIGHVTDFPSSYEWTVSQDVQYHVASVRGIFNKNNPTVIENYCADFDASYKRKILIVVDTYPGNILSQIQKYFDYHSAAIGDFRILPMSITSECKNTESVSRVVNAGIELGMTQRDLFIAIGGGTLMDIVGFAAEIYRGGTQYVRIPTTLVGIIDAGVGVKVGVNLGDSKNSLGGYYAPVACLNDPVTFLGTLPQREFACGLAEALKMAIIKSPRLFEVIENHHRTVEYNSYSDELIYASIYTMLEELQPNLDEKTSLMRPVDFGHEFGHIVEGLAHYQIPHGECVAIGMGISSFLAYLKGILSLADLERILYCILDVGLPIYTDEYDCCNPQVLWEKIRTDGIMHKDGMLYLVVPETIGKSCFIDNITDIDPAMVHKAVHGLIRYSNWHQGKLSLRAKVFDESSLCATRHALIGGTLAPTGVYLPVDTLENQVLCMNIEEGLFRLSAVLRNVLLAQGIQEERALHYLPRNEWHISLVDDPLSYGPNRPFEMVPWSKSRLSQGVLARHAVFKGTVEGMCISRDGAIRVQVIPSNQTLNLLRQDIAHALGLPTNNLATESKAWITVGYFIQNVPLTPQEAQKVEGVIEQGLLNCGFGEVEISRAAGQKGQEFVFGQSPSSVLNGVGVALRPSPVTTAAIIGASGDLGSQLADYLVDNGFQVICSVRSASLPTFMARSKQYNDSKMRIVIGDVLDSTNLQDIIKESDIIYNMAGIVTLSSKPDQFPKVFALNGFTQGVIAHYIQQLGRDGDIKVVYPSTQRVHLINDSTSVDTWIQGAMEAFNSCRESFIDERDLSEPLEAFVEQFISRHPLPSGYNVYEISKKLGEHFVSLLPKHSLVRISSVYGATFKRGFMYRAVNPKPEGNIEAPERRDFIYIDDLNELLLKVAHTHTAGSQTFDAASGQSIDLREVWTMVREIIGDQAPVVFKDDVPQEDMSPDPDFARSLLGRDFVPMHIGLRKTIDGSRCIQSSHSSQSSAVSEHSESFKSFEAEEFTAPTTPGEFNMDGEDGNHVSATGSAAKSRELPTPHGRPHVIVIDVGATYLRIGIMASDGHLLYKPTRILSPSKQLHPTDTVSELQEKLVERLVHEIDTLRSRHSDITLEDVGISFGAIITTEGIVENASILWSDSVQGYDFKSALLERLPGIRFTILNDVSAAAWRYKDEGRFCLITVSSGLSNKVFNPELSSLCKLDIDSAGLGGEMGHVVMEPRAVDMLVRHAITQATAHPEGFQRSKLMELVGGDTQKINARYLGIAVKEGDAFAMGLLEEADVPFCPCGNLADLCSYSSGRGALRLAKRLASRRGYDVIPDDITDSWLKEAIAMDHPLALQTLYDATYPLALRILQLAADIGLEKFIIVGGFATKTGQKKYLAVLQDHLVRLCHNSGFFTSWTEDKIRALVQFGVKDDNDGLIGMGYFVRHISAQFPAVEKAVGEESLSLVTRSIPRCGAREILTKVVFTGICTTDLQIFRQERGLEPTVLGHEGVLQVVEVGKNVKGVRPGSLVVLNPNNPLDDHVKIGHNFEGLFQGYFKFGQEYFDRGQVLTLESSIAHPVDTLIEPLSCVVAAQGRIKDRVAGKNVLVIGAGIMGLMFVVLNGKMGARNVFLANRSQSRLDFAVGKGIVPQDKVFVIGDDVTSKVDQVSAGQGVDIVIVCVSLGQGTPTAEAAVSYMNPGGCVYLYAGFQSGDFMTVDGGEQVDLQAIRVNWKTDPITKGGKQVYLSGHRGSRHEDLAMAAKLIHEDTLSFSKVVSHIISLDTVPEIMPMLARNGQIDGVPARRVIVDMGSQQHKVVELMEELPLHHLREAAGKPKNSVHIGNLYRDIGFDGDTSMLGWVHPPAWQDIKATLERVLQIKALDSKKHYIFVGTGAWGFIVEILKGVIPQGHEVTVHTLQSLAPQALVDLLSQVDDLSTAVCLGVSQSGTTLETVILMNALRERFDNAGLDYRDSFVWLTDLETANPNCKSGETTIREFKEHDWKDVDMVPLTVRNHGDINALFCAPYSTVMFLALAIFHQKDMKVVEAIYQQYLTQKDQVVGDIPARAYGIASNNIENIQINLDEAVAPLMTRLIIQLIEQSLGSKQAGFNPRVHVASGGQLPGFKLLPLSIPPETPPVVSVMLAMNALAIFVAMVAYHLGINFVTHPKVNLYKRKAIELMTSPEIDHQITTPPVSIADEIATYVDCNPATRFVEVLCYGHVSMSYQETIRGWLDSWLALRNSHVSIDVIPGEQWNHSAYQAAVQMEDTLYVILVLPRFTREVEGISKETIQENSRMLKAISQATYQTLRPKALIFGIDDDFPKASEKI